MRNKIKRTSVSPLIRPEVGIRLIYFTLHNWQIYLQYIHGLIIPNNFLKKCKKFWNMSRLLKEKLLFFLHNSLGDAAPALGWKSYAAPVPSWKIMRFRTQGKSRKKW
jgi:hypothetical protein